MAGTDTEHGAGANGAGAHEEATHEEATQEEWDFEREWAEAREAAVRDGQPVVVGVAQAGEAEPADLSPYVLLYTGFLLGPPASLLSVLLLMGRGFRLRVAAFALGICGATWVTSQAATLGLIGHWPGVALQMLRTGDNFLAGLVLLWFLRREASVPFVHDRQTYMNTLIFAVLLVVLYVSLPHKVLLWLGR